MGQLALNLLGAPRLEQEGRVIEFDTRKAMALLAYLALNPGIHARDTLATLLWADYDQSSARAALRRTLSVLHRAVGEGVLEIERETLGVASDAPICFDIAEFRRLLDECKTHGHAPSAVCPRCLGPLSEAVQLYRDDFMAGFTLRDSPEFDDWQFYQTETLRRELAEALEHLTQGLAVQGDFENAISQARRRLALDPFHEPAHRQLMQLYARAGQFAAALRQYQECTRILEAELGVPPMPETIELYQSIKEQRFTPPAPPEEPAPQPVGAIPPASRQPAQSLPLVGRERELASLEMQYAAIRTDGTFLAIVGEAGIGKTRLAEEFTGRMHHPGTITITTRCYAGETGLAYSPFIDGFRSALKSAPSTWHQSLEAQWINEAARLLPELAQAHPGLPPAPSLENPGAQARFFEGVSRVLEAFCTPAPGAPVGIFFIDDLQWADDASLDLLTYLVRRLRSRRLLVLATWRPEDISPDHRLHRLLAEGQRGGYAGSISLDRLDSTAVQELVATAATAELGAPDGDLSQRLFQETEGLPLFIAEYLASGSERDWNLPRGVRDILRSRLDAVDPAGAQLLQTAAVIGRSFDFETLQEANGRSDEETVTTLENLLERGIIRETHTGERSLQLAYDFNHDKMRSLVYAEISQARRRILHQRVAESLLRHARGPREQKILAGSIAHHFRQAGQTQEAAEYSRLAGEHARLLYANAEALSHFQNALALGHRDVIRLEETIGDLFTLMGNYQAALTSYQSGAGREGASPQQIARLKHRMGDVYHRLGEWEKAEGCFRAAVDGLEGSDLSSLYADWSRTMRRAGKSEQALQTAARALELAQNAGDAPALAQAHNMLGMLLRLAGQQQEAIDHLEQSLAIAEVLPHPEARIAALNNLSLAYADHGELERALESANAALELCTRLGDRHREAALHSNLADLYHAAGMESTSMAHLKQSVVIFSEIGANETDRPRPEIWKLTEW